MCVLWFPKYPHLLRSRSLEGDVVSPGTSQKEGQEDQGEMKELGRPPLTSFNYPGLLAFTLAVPCTPWHSPQRVCLRVCTLVLNADSNMRRCDGLTGSSGKSQKGGQVQQLERLPLAFLHFYAPPVLPSGSSLDSLPIYHTSLC